MSLSLIASATGYTNARDVAVDCSSSLNVAAGDLLVAVCTWFHWDLSAFTSVVDTDGSTNAMTLSAVTTQGDNYQGFGYRLVAQADETATFRLTTGNRDGGAYFTVYQFRPDTGDTVTLDVAASGAGDWYSSAPASGAITTTGTDEVVLGVVANLHSRTYTTPLIGGSAVTGSNNYGPLHLAMYQLRTTTMSSGAASATMSNSGTWAATVIAFISTAGAGGIAVPVAMHHLQTQGVL